MRGLTPEERGALTNLATPHDITETTPDDEAVLTDLQEQGRAQYMRFANDDEWDGVWSITRAGREALKLWPALREALRAP